MKKNNGLVILLGMVIILLSLGALLFPLGTGFTTDLGDKIVAYDFIFGNSAAGINTYHGGPYGGLITAFVFACVGVFFQLIALLFSFGQGGKKFVGFMDVVAGLCFATTAVLYFLARGLVDGYLNNTVPLTLAWGFLVAGACAAASALLSIGTGVVSFRQKE